MVLTKPDVGIAGVDGKPLSTHSDDTADRGDPSGLTREELEFVRDYPNDKRKKVLRKIDLGLVPCLTLVYLLAYIDRGNIGESFCWVFPCTTVYAHSTSSRQEMQRSKALSVILALLTRSTGLVSASFMYHTSCSVRHHRSCHIEKPC